MSDYSRGDYADLPAGTTDLENNYSAPDLTAIASNDNSTYAEQTANNEIAIHQYKKTITSQYTNILWSGKSSLAPSESPVILEVYNVTGTPAWEELDRDDSTAVDTDFDLSYNGLATADYLDTGVITWRVWQAASGASWIAPGWSYNDGTLTWTPGPVVTGDNLLTNPTFASGAASWSSLGTPTVSTTTDAQDGDSAALAVVATAQYDRVYQNASTTKLLAYYLSLYAKRVSGTTEIYGYIDDGGLHWYTQNYADAAYTIKYRSYIAQATSSIIYIFRDDATGSWETWHLDNVVFKQLSQVTALYNYGSQKAVSAALTIPTHCQAGLITRYSDSSNFIMALFDQQVGWGYLFKFIGGVMSAGTDGSISYVNGRVGEIRWSDGNTAQLYYNNAQVGSNVDVTAVPAGGYAGMVATDAAVQIVSFTAS